MSENHIIKETYVNEIVINKSKFIAILFPINSVEMFNEKLESIKVSYPKAKHYVYAYKVNNLAKMTDDHEPHGTGGKPILELMNKKEISNAAIVVVRYFGGTKLGASRLLRAYLNSAVEVIKLSEK